MKFIENPLKIVSAIVSDSYSEINSNSLSSKSFFVNHLCKKFCVYLHLKI